MKSLDLITPEALEEMRRRAEKIAAELDRILLGQKELHRLILIGVLSRGHILLEGLPGVGKTALVKALGELMSLEFKRIQFTPDLLPSDILGCNILQEMPDRSRKLVFQPGAIFTNLLLADEINRASPKTQSAMLEAMQEEAVTLLGETRPLPRPFFVLASQNPVELEGTYPIPEAQLDRFLFKLNVKQVDADTLTEIIAARRRGIPPTPDWKLSRAELDELFDAMGKIHLARPVASYMARLVEASHPDAVAAPPEVRRFVSYGASPRAAIALGEAARAAALLAGRPTVSFEDVRLVAGPILNHRLILNYQARLEKVTGSDLAQLLLDKVDAAGIDWPDGVTVETGGGK